MPDLVAFLRQRLDEDEKVAREALTADEWWAGSADFDEDAGGNLIGDGAASVNDGGGIPPHPIVIFVQSREKPPHGYDVVEHIADWQPTRVLREVEAKRGIMEEHDGDQYCYTCGSNSYPVRQPCPTIRLLALPYDSHPDYRQKWKP